MPFDDEVTKQNAMGALPKVERKRRTTSSLAPAPLLLLYAVFTAWCVANVSARKQHTHVFCDRISPMVVRECPADYPVCCIWPDGVFTACCPERNLCDLYAGECVEMTNRTTSGGGDDYDSGVVKGTQGRPDQSQAGVEVSLQFASSFVGLAFFGFLLMLSASIQAGKLYAMRREEARRQRELEERELLVARDHAEADAPANGTDAANAGDVNDASNEEGAAHTSLCEDEDLLCKVCFSNPLDSALIKCGHISTCRWCAKKLSQCPICREHVTSIVVIPNVEAIRAAQNRTATNREGNTGTVALVVRMGSPHRPEADTSSTTTAATERKPKDEELRDLHDDADGIPATAVVVVVAPAEAESPDPVDDVAAAPSGENE